MSDPSNIPTSTSTPTPTSTDPTPTDPPTAPIPIKEGINKAESYIEELKTEIAKLRTDMSSNNNRRDEAIGGLQAKIEAQQEYIDDLVKQVQKRVKSTQTLVPPPPPPPQTAEPTKPTEDDNPLPRKKGFFRSVW